MSGRAARKSDERERASPAGPLLAGSLAVAVASIAALAVLRNVMAPLVLTGVNPLVAGGCAGRRSAAALALANDLRHRPALGHLRYQCDTKRKTGSDRPQLAES